MKNVRLLDCTLRDGGRMFDCAYSDDAIKEITSKLVNANIDMIEVGFLRDSGLRTYKRDSTFFTDVDQIIPFIGDKKSSTMYLAFIDFGMFNFDTLKPCDGRSVDGIRFGFTKKNYDQSRSEIVQCMRMIQEKGYFLFVQSVNTLEYSDKELLDLLDFVNQIHPYSFGIVDTYGSMYSDDLARLYSLVDHNLRKDICIDFHSHNNYQLSFSLALEFIRLSQGVRQVILDATLNGMGKMSGNLNTELIADFLSRKRNYGYDIEGILDVIDDYIYPYASKYSWGYSIPGMLAGVFMSHQNNVIYLMNKNRLQTKDIGRILSKIDPKVRLKYDYDILENLYIEYVAEKVDDTAVLEELGNDVRNREVLLLVPGNTLNTYKGEITDYIEKYRPVIFSVNYVTEYPKAYAFFGNQKRYAKQKKQREHSRVIISSNVRPDCEKDRIIDYYSLLNKKFSYFENSTIMLLNLFRRIVPQKIVIAGFDGYREGEQYYLDGSFGSMGRDEDLAAANDQVGKMFVEIQEDLSGRCKIELLTPTNYNIPQTALFDHHQ